MNDISSTLWFVWCIYWLSAALVGAFLGNLLADLIKFTIKKIINTKRGK